MNYLPWLSLSIWLPILVGLIILVVCSESEARIIRWLALMGAVLSLIVTLPLIFTFDKTQSSLQFVEYHRWIPYLGIAYHLGVNGLSLWFIPLTAFTTLIVVIAGWEVINHRIAQYYAAFLILSGLMIGVFSAANALLFYVFFEATLIPMYLIIGIWGGKNRVYAAFKFFLYTLAGSLLMLVALIYLMLYSGTTALHAWRSLPLPMDAQILLFIAFFFAFAVKVPMWPVHTWLPDAHVEAPTGGSVVLAAIMLKLGAYGFLVFSLPITPDAAHFFAPMMITLSIIAVIYIGMVALVQTDMKKLIAYSSIAHMGFVTLGFFMFNPLALEGAIVHMISHGFVSGAMFLCIGVLYDRLHTREISAYGGVVNSMPKFAAFSLLFAMANAGLPGTSGFVGEFIVILGTVQVNFWLGLLAASTLVFGAAYSLWMYKRVYFGAAENSSVANLKDINARETFILLILAVFVLLIGIYPQPLTAVIHESASQLLFHVSKSKLI